MTQVLCLLADGSLYFWDVATNTPTLLVQDDGLKNSAIIPMVYASDSQIAGIFNDILHSWDVDSNYHLMAQQLNLN